MMSTNPITIPTQRGAQASTTRHASPSATDPFAQMLERQRASTATADCDRTSAAERTKPATNTARPADSSAAANTAPAAVTDTAAVTNSLPDQAASEVATAAQPAEPTDAALAQAAAAAMTPALNPLVSQIQELTERSRALAETVVALKTTPTDLPAASTTLLPGLTDELPLPGTTAAAALAQDTPTLLPGLAVAAPTTTTPGLMSSASTLPTATADPTALLLPAATPTTSGWQAPAAGQTAAELAATNAASAATLIVPAVTSLAPEALAPQPALASDILLPPATPPAAPDTAIWVPPLQAAGQSAPAVPLPPAIQAQVAVPLQSPQWGAAFGQQMVRLGTDGQQGLRHVELRIDPPDLGPVRISLSLAGEQASAWFISPHAAVRQAIEQALPQLHQALADAGIQLGHTSVGEQHDSQPTSEGGTGRQRDDGTLLANGDEDAGLPPAPRAAPRGLIDTFA